jgi:hypothetical protein
MKNLLIIFSMFVVYLSYGANDLGSKEENLSIDLCKKIESIFFKIEKVSKCLYQTSTTTTVNADGSSTLTTTTTVSCDTPEELAIFNAIALQIITE